MGQTKMVRVEFFFEDGSSKFIEGNDVQRWNEFNKHVATIAHVHKQNPNWHEINWKINLPEKIKLATEKLINENETNDLLHKDKTSKNTGKGNKRSNK